MVEKRPVKRVISQYSYFRNGKRVVVPSHSRIYHKGRKYRSIPQRTDTVIDSVELTQPRGKKLPDNIRLEWDTTKFGTVKSPRINLIDRNTDKRAGHIWIDKSYDGKNAWLKELEIEPEYRGQGLSLHLMDSFTKWADKERITVRLKSQAYGFEWDEDMGDMMRVTNNPKAVRKLTRYYKKFGFKADRGIEKDANNDWAQFMTRKPKMR